MRSGVMVALLATFGFSEMAIAGPVERSLRPQARPATEPVQVASVATSPTLRPVARPEGLGSPEIRVANAAFQRWIDGFKRRAAAQGISSGTLNRAFRGVQYNTSVIQKDRNQIEFTKKIWDYLDNAANPVRVQNGQKAIRQNSRALNQIEAKYGVDKEVVAAVWGLESTYGERRGDIPVIEALSTLAFDGRRGSFFEKQLIAALKILQSGDVSPSKMTGSWAGAMGHTQFIPTSYLAYAVDFTGDGKRDIWSNNPTDALASTAAYLARHGWVRGMPWGVEVRAPRGAGVGQSMMPSQWAARGVVGVDGRAVRDYGIAKLWQPAGANGPSFLLFKNFNVILRYNNAESYALGVGHLSDRLKGKPPIQASWPRGYDPLSFDEKKEMQRLLKRKGYKIEKIDGLIGPNTVGAIKAFQKSAGVAADGYPSKTLLRLLKSR